MASAGIGEEPRSLQPLHPARCWLRPDWLTSNPQQQWHRERGWVADAMFPEAIFTPTIAVIGANKHGVIGEILQQWLELLIHPFKAGTLATAALAP